MKLSRRALLGSVSAIAALAALTTPARAAVAIVAHGVGNFATTSVSSAFNGTGANTLVVFAETNGASAPSVRVKDSQGNYYYGPFLRCFNQGSTAWTFVAYNANVSASMTITADFPSTSGVMMFVALSGAASVNPVVAASYGANDGFVQSGNSVSLTSGNYFVGSALSTFDAGTMILTWVNNSAAPAPTCTGFTTIDNSAGRGTAYNIVSAGASTNPTWTWTGGAVSLSKMVAIAITPVTPQNVIFSVANSGDLQPSNSDSTVLDKAIGGSNINTTYFSLGKTVPTGSTNTTTTITLDPAETAAATVGHPITCAGKGICIIKSVSGQVATVGALVGSGGTYASAFSSAPAVGDSYTIWPMSVTYLWGASATNRQWGMNVNTNTTPGLPIIATLGTGTPITSPGYGILHQGAFARNIAAAPGTVPTTGSCVSVLNAVTSGGRNTLFGFGPGYITMNDIDMVCQNASDTDGALMAINNPSASNRLLCYTFNRCQILDNSGSSDPDLNTWFTPDTYGSVGWTMNACVLIAEAVTLREPMTFPGYMNDCTLVNTANYIGTSATLTSSGTNTITLQTGQGANVIISYHFAAAGSAIPTGNFVTGVAGDVVTLNSNVTASIPLGTQIHFGGNSVGGIGNLGGLIANNTAIFGFSTPFPAGASNNVAAAYNCFADNNIQGTSGVTVASYPAAFVSASGQRVSSLNLTPKAGGALIGPGTPFLTFDLYNRSRAGDTTVGAVIYQAASSGIKGLVGGHVGSLL